MNKNEEKVIAHHITSIVLLGISYLPVLWSVFKWIAYPSGVDDSYGLGMILTFFGSIPFVFLLWVGAVVAYIIAICSGKRQTEMGKRLFIINTVMLAIPLLGIAGCAGSCLNIRNVALEALK